MYVCIEGVAILLICTFDLTRPVEDVYMSLFREDEHAYPRCLSPAVSKVYIYACMYMCIDMNINV